jgi:formylglycine-generating enzyme required for sulfatase activity
VDKQGEVTLYQANSPGEKYVEQGLKLPSGALPLEMVVIPAGSFTMGSPFGVKESWDDSKPQRQVRVKQFLMGRYEVTQAQYEAVMGTNPTAGEAYMLEHERYVIGQIPSKFLGGNKPVVGVSWDDAQEFIRRLNQMTGKRYRLPTEAEWEYGARAGTTSNFSFGFTITPEVANYNATSYEGVHQDETNPNPWEVENRDETMDVNTFYPNPWGLYHIHGNVWEWVEDYWHDNYEGAPTDGSAWLTGGDQRSRVRRGGSWSSPPWFLHSSSRLDGILITSLPLSPKSYGFNVGSPDTGFRLVLSF